MKKNQPTTYHEIMKQLNNKSDPEPVTPKSKILRKPLQIKNHNTFQKHAFSQKDLNSHTQSLGLWEKSQEFSLKEKDMISFEDEKKFCNKKSKKQKLLNYNKMVSEITKILACITKDKPPEMLYRKISYIEFLETLKQLKMMKQSYEPSAGDLVGQLWNNEISGQNVGTLLMVIISILKMGVNQLKSYEVEVANRYALLRYTKLELHGQKIKNQNYTENQFTFAPFISARSKQIMKTHSKSQCRSREKTSDKNSSFKKDLSSNHLHKTQSCEPIVNNEREPIGNNERENHNCNSKIGNKRSQILYKMAKEKSIQKKKDKRSVDVEYEKSITELTFKPEIHPNMKEKIKTTINGEKDSISRMIRGRVDRQVRKIIHQRGLPYNEKLVSKIKKQKLEIIMKSQAEPHFKENNNSTMNFIELDDSKEHQNCIESVVEEKTNDQKQSCHGEPLILNIEVEEGRCQKLIIHQNEPYEKAAAKFCEDYNLGEELYLKLVKGVEKALKFQLTQIDEDSFEEDYQSVHV